ncbi:MAG: hypothetical protein KBA26_08200 [Candidatus Delongbacteria bacterium]|nr:hypothetical protein [Candidatus Delongbacteria bacterium]
MNPNPIFIHSLFRTGSTYLWNKFRLNPDYICFYEPLHQSLRTITTHNISQLMTTDYQSAHHPDLERFYLQEYIPLLRNDQTGIPYFEKQFSFEGFCMGPRATNAPLKHYFDHLLSFADQRIPLLKLNRSALRSGWFHHSYPLSYHLYLIRNPRDQWQSYHKLNQRMQYTGFFVMDLMTAGLNSNHHDFKPLSRIIPLIRIQDEYFEKEYELYQLLSKHYTPGDQYLLFYYIWFLALIKNLLDGIRIVSINRLSTEPLYRKNLVDDLHTRGYEGVDFEDCHITEYSTYVLDHSTMSAIEKKVQGMILNNLDPVEQSQSINLIKAFIGDIPDESLKTIPSSWKPYESYTPNQDLIESYRQNQKIHQIIKMITREWIDELNAENESIFLRTAHTSDTIKMEPKIPAGKRSQKNLIINCQFKTLIDCLYEQFIVREESSINDEMVRLGDWDNIKYPAIEFKSKIYNDGAHQDKADRNIIQTNHESTVLRNGMNQQIKELKDEIGFQKSTLLRQHNQIIWLQNENKQLLSKIQSVYDSYSYRTGNRMIEPFRKTRKAFIRMKKKMDFKIPWKPAPIFYTPKLDLADQLEINYGTHRSGLKYGLNAMKRLHIDHGILFDAFIERTFCWNPWKIESHLRPWIGFIHVPHNMPSWFHPEQTNQAIFNLPQWRQSIPYCRGLYTFSNYHRQALQPLFYFPINSLIYPNEIPERQWSWKGFVDNQDKKIIQIGWWLRKLHAIYQLPSSLYRKIFLKVNHDMLPSLMEIEYNLLMEDGSFSPEMYQTAETMEFLSNQDYDDLLSENIVFVHLYDASANNTVTECIARNTPLLVNPIEPVVEYLGPDYPFYYHSYEEAIQKATDMDIVRQTHEYLNQHPLKTKMTADSFLQQIIQSEIYQSL